MKRRGLLTALGMGGAAGVAYYATDGFSFLSGDESLSETERLSDGWEEDMQEQLTEMDVAYGGTNVAAAAETFEFDTGIASDLSIEPVTDDSDRIEVTPAGDIDPTFLVSALEAAWDVTGENSIVVETEGETTTLIGGEADDIYAFVGVASTTNTVVALRSPTLDTLEDIPPVEDVDLNG